MTRSFRGSSTSRCQLTIYFDGEEAGLTRLSEETPGDNRFLNSRGEDTRTVSTGRGALTINARDNTDVGPALVALETDKVLGAPYGTWFAQIKIRDDQLQSFLYALSDDDWVDISFTRDNRPYHVMRGLIGSVTIERRASGGGATDTTLVLSGYDFGYIFAITPVFFNHFAGDFPAFAVDRMQQFFGTLNGSPGEITSTLLKGFMAATTNTPVFSTAGGEALTPNLLDLDYAEATGIQWQLPSTMPLAYRPQIEQALKSRNLPTKLGFGTVFSMYFGPDFLEQSRAPRRAAPVPPSLFLQADSTVWELAQEWQDAGLSEMWCDLALASTDRIVDGRPNLANASQLAPVALFPVNEQGWGPQSNPSTTHMAVFHRDRPFPETVSLRPGENIYDHPWFRLPTFKVDERDLTGMTLSRSGTERRNTFFTNSTLLQSTGLKFDVFPPRWSTADISRHGFRRMSYTSPYYIDLTKLPENERTVQETVEFESYKEKIQQLHMLNHLYFSGQLSLAGGRPDIRVGYKVEIPSEVTHSLTAYVEQVTHSWSFEQGVRTRLGVTRGWFGDPRDYGRLHFIQASQFRAATLKPDSQTQPLPPNQGTGQFPWATRYPPGDPATDTLFGRAAEYILEEDGNDIRIWIQRGTDEYKALFGAGGNKTAGERVLDEKKRKKTITDDEKQTRRLLRITRIGLLGVESAGYVGYPTYTFGDLTKTKEGWEEAWRLVREKKTLAEGISSSATGLGQLTGVNPDNVGKYYPDGSDGIGDAFNEAVGMLRYVEDNFDTPMDARDRWVDIGSY